MKLLQVVANPYRTLDADGNPIAIYPCHAKHAPGEYVAAKLQLEVIEPAETISIKRKDRRGGFRMETIQVKPDRSRAIFTFGTEPVGVPADGAIGAYYRVGVRRGALIPADQRTAFLCGVQFVPADQVLAKERERAAKEYHSQWGELPAWAQQENQPAPIAAPK